MNAIYATAVVDSHDQVWQRVVRNENGVCVFREPVRVRGAEYEYRCCETAVWLMNGDRENGYCARHFSAVTRLDIGIDDRPGGRSNPTVRRDYTDSIDLPRVEIPSASPELSGSGLGKPRILRRETGSAEYGNAVSATTRLVPHLKTHVREPEVLV